jgi:hypothetical protein
MFHLFLLLLFCSVVHSYPQLIATKIIFTNQSSGTPFAEWNKLFTLCLAPLVAHVASGVVSSTILGGSQGPSWSAYLPHFNPLSIVWRYYIIADRRVRARSWDQCDMAGCNALFWDAERKRWDGSEEIMVRSRAWITKIPEKSHVRLLSGSFFQTTVLTFQGTMLLFFIIEGLRGETIPGASTLQGRNAPEGLDGLFVALQALGLMRLPAALWISSDYGYQNFRGTDMVLERVETPLEKHVSKNILEARVSNHQSEEDVRDRLLPLHCWQGVLYRGFWLLTIWGILGAAASSCSMFFWGYDPALPYVAISHLLWQIMYLILSTSTILLFTVYIFQGKTHSTVIPCIHETWYKIFTMFFIIMVGVIAVLLCLETRVRVDGTTTALPVFLCGEVGTVCSIAKNGPGNFNI